MRSIEEIAADMEGAKLPDVDFESYYEANEEDRKKLRRVVDFFEEIEDYCENGVSNKGAKLPFDRTRSLFGFRGGEVTMWSGYNSHKKSMMLSYVMIAMMRQSEKVCIASFEMKPMSTIVRMTRQYTGVKSVGYSEIGDLMQFAASDFYLFDHMGGINPDRLYGVILYATKELGVKHFVIDSLMRVVAGEDDYNRQKDFVVKLCDIAIQADAHIHLVHHVRDGDETKVPSRYNAKGSKAISDNVHNSLVVWSNKHEIEDKPDVILKCDKQREGEWEGSLALNFDPVGLTFTEDMTNYD